MLPRWHILYGFVFSYILVYFFEFSLFAGLIIFLSSIFIDLDHVLLYYLETKNLHPKKFLDWNDKKALAWENISIEERKQLKSPHFILHGIEFILVLSILSFFSEFFIWILLGIVLHLLLDYLDIYYNYQDTHFSYKFSQIWLFYRNIGKRAFVN